MLSDRADDGLFRGINKKVSFIHTYIRAHTLKQGGIGCLYNAAFVTLEDKSSRQPLCSLTKPES